MRDCHPGKQLIVISLRTQLGLRISIHNFINESAVLKIIIPNNESMDDNKEDANLKVIYPAYINSSRTVVRGRRVTLKHAVPDPKLHEIKEALEQLKGFHIVPEPNKTYCRELDKEAYCGRVRYRNNNPDKNNCKNKKQVLVACADTINRIRSQKKPAAVQQNADLSQEGGSKKGGKGKKGQQK